MNKLICAAALAGSSFLICAAPAHAHGDVRWSVTVGSPGYYSAPPPGVVVYPQSQYIYGAPPSAFAPPPNVVYITPQPVYQVAPPATLYADPYFYQNVPRPYYERRDDRYDRGHHDHGHREWRDQDRREPHAERR